MEKKIHPESLQQHQKFLPHPYVNSTSMVVKKTLEKARRAKEKIDNALCEREAEICSSSEKIHGKSWTLAKKGQILIAAKNVQRKYDNLSFDVKEVKQRQKTHNEVSQEEEDDEAASISDISSSEKERVLDKVPAVDDDDDNDDDEFEENYSEIAEDSDVEEQEENEEESKKQKEEEEKSSDKIKSIKVPVITKSSSTSNIYTETKATNNKNPTSIIIPKQLDNNTITCPITKNNVSNRNPGKGIKEKEFVVLREKKINSTSDTDSSLDKKLCSVNSDQGSSCSSSEIPLSNLSSNSNDKEKKVHEKKFKNINTDNEDDEDDNNTDDDEDNDDETPESTNEMNTNESNSDAFMSVHQSMFPAIDPESMMGNPWFSHFYQRFNRPNWDSSPYNPSCNRPAWDQSLYVEAKERFQRHEAVKLNNNNMLDFSTFPTYFNGSGMMDGSPFFDMNRFQKAYFQFGQMSGNRSRHVQTSKRVFNKIKNSPQIKKIISPGVGGIVLHDGKNDEIKKKNLQNVINNNMIINNNNNNNNNNISPTNNNDNYTSQGKLVTPTSTSSQRAGSIESKASSFSTKSSLLDTNNNNNNGNNNSSNYRNQRSRSCPKSSKVFQNTVNRRNNQQKTAEPIKPQKLIPNPLPRVAHLTKASLRRTSEQSSNIQVIDERGRPRIKWNPSPFVSINKSSAWDSEHNSSQNDYYRLKYFGWM